MKETILSQIKILEFVKSEVQEQVKKYCQNTTYPIDERWEIFIDSNLGYHRDYFVHFDTFDVVEEILPNRHETLYVHTFPELYEEYLYYYEDYSYDNEEDRIIVETYVNNFKEEILQTFVKSFKFDW